MEQLVSSYSDIVIAFGVYALFCISVGLHFYFQVSNREPHSSYGYKSPRAMSSKDAWRMANRYSGKVLIHIGLASAFLAYFLDSIQAQSESYFILFILFVMSSSLSIFAFTERFLLKELEK